MSERPDQNVGLECELDSPNLARMNSNKTLNTIRWSIILLAFSLVSCADLLRQSAKGPELKVAAVPSIPPPSIIISSEQSVAEQAAKQIAKGGEPAIQALIKALVEAGFPVVINQQRFALPNGDNGLGAPVFDWEIKALVSEASGSFVVPLPMLGKILNMIPEFETIPWNEVILTSLRESAQSTSSETRFWAYLVDEIGKRRFGISLLDPTVTADRVLLTSLQYQLILRRLISEILLAESRVIGMKPDQQAPILFASLTPLFTHLLAQNYKSTLDQCRKIGGQEISNVEALEGKFFDDLVYKQLEKRGVGRAAKIAGKVSRFLGAVGALFDLVKAGILVASVNVQHRLEEGEPLVRTKKTTDNYERTIVLTVSFGLAPAEYVNCTRPLGWTGATAGAVLEAPLVGPAKDATVLWEGLDGFFDNQWVKFRDNNGTIVPSPEDEEWAEAIRTGVGEINLATGPGRPRTGQGYRSITDGNGVTKTTVKGRAQPVELSEASVAIDRRATILTQIATNGFDLGDFLATPTSLVYTAAKAGLFSFHSIEFQVIDWAPEYILKLSSTGNYSRPEVMPVHLIETQGEIRLKPRKDSLGHIVYEASGTRKVDVRPYGKCGIFIETTSGEEVVEITGTIPSPEQAELRMCHRVPKLSMSNMTCPCNGSGCFTTKINEAGRGDVDHPSGVTAPLNTPNTGSTLFIQHWQTEASNRYTGWCVDLKDWQPATPNFYGKPKFGAQIRRESDSCPFSGFALATSCSSHFYYDLTLPKDKVGTVR